MIEEVNRKEFQMTQTGGISIIMVAVQFSVSKIPYVTPIVFPGQNLDFPNIGIEQELDPGSVLTCFTLDTVCGIPQPKNLCSGSVLCISCILIPFDRSIDCMTVCRRKMLYNILDILDNVKQ